MPWQKAASESELTGDERQVVTIDDQKILLFKHDGQVHAVEAACPHMSLPLKKGDIKDDAIVCPWHKSAFDLKSGDVKAWSPWPPVIGKLLACVKREKALKVYRTKIEASQVFVET